MLIAATVRTSSITIILDLQFFNEELWPLFHILVHSLYVATPLYCPQWPLQVTLFMMPRVVFPRWICFPWQVILISNSKLYRIYSRFINTFFLLNRPELTPGSYVPKKLVRSVGESDTVPRILLEEKQQECLARDETIRVKIMCSSWLI